MDFNEARLHEATLTLHTHALIFSHLLIVSVDGKQHLSEVVFSGSLRIFVVRKMTGSRSYPNIQDFSRMIVVFMKLGSLFVESRMSCESWV